MREISSAAYHALKIREQTLEEEIRALETDLDQAIGFGDLSENTEYDSAKNSITLKSAQKAEIEQILRTAKIRQTYSNTISPGTLITVKLLESNEYPEEDFGLLMFDEIGDLVLEGRVSPDSALGGAIQGGVSGVYTVQDIKGRTQRYEVTVEQESRLEEFLAKYPADKKKMLDRIFKEGE